eukprot:1849172-Amphidinium_carterae.2
MGHQLNNCNDAKKNDAQTLHLQTFPGCTPVDVLRTPFRTRTLAGTCLMLVPAQLARSEGDPTVEDNSQTGAFLSASGAPEKHCSGAHAPELGPYTGGNTQWQCADLVDVLPPAASEQ